MRKMIDMKLCWAVNRGVSPLLSPFVFIIMGIWTASASDTAISKEESGFSLPPLTAVDASKRDEWERLGKEADRFLADRSFVVNWRARADFRTPTGARQALREADERLKKLDDAVQKKSGACLYTFFVNYCIDKARKTSFLRKREIRTLMNDARAVLHEEEKKEHEKERLAREAKKPKAPMKIDPKKVDAEPKEPVRIAPKDVRPPSLPTSLTPKVSREASLPNVPKGARIEPTDTNDHNATREALEEANVAAQAQREEERKLRQQKAEEKAKARKAKRKAKQQKLEETMAQREAAQRRLEEEREKGKQSGLFSYF